MLRDGVYNDWSMVDIYMEYSLHFIAYSLLLMHGYTKLFDYDSFTQLLSYNGSTQGHI